MIVSDHGHERVVGSYDLARELRRVSVPRSDYAYFLEVSSARFWFDTDAARAELSKLLATIPNATVVRYDAMARYGLPLRDARYGEVFVYLDPGHIFFPHDFHQPLANLWLGLSDRMQRARLRDPRHRGNHGHLPHFDAERSFALLLDRRFEVARATGSILDVAPSILAVMGREAPATMTGRPLFTAIARPER
jgi:hypothetical protein